MRLRISGTDSATGRSVELVVDCDSYAEAEHFALSKGVVAGKIEGVPTGPVPAEPPATDTERIPEPVHDAGPPTQLDGPPVRRKERAKPPRPPRSTDVRSGNIHVVQELPKDLRDRMGRWEVTGTTLAALLLVFFSLVYISDLFPPEGVPRTTVSLPVLLIQCFLPGSVTFAVGLIAKRTKHPYPVTVMCLGFGAVGLCMLAGLL